MKTRMMLVWTVALEFIAWVVLPEGKFRAAAAAAALVLWLMFLVRVYRRRFQATPTEGALVDGSPDGTSHVVSQGTTVKIKTRTSDGSVVSVYKVKNGDSHYYQTYTSRKDPK